MRSIVVDGIPWSVCLSVTIVSPAKTTENWTDLDSFSLGCRLGWSDPLRNCVLDEGPDHYRKRQFWSRNGRPLVKYTEYRHGLRRCSLFVKLFWPLVNLWPPCVLMRSRCRHYIFVVWFLLSFFYLSVFFLAYSQPSQIGCLPYFHTWRGISANLGRRSETCCMRLTKNTGRKKSPKIRHLRIIGQHCRAISSQTRSNKKHYTVFATKARIDNREKSSLNIDMGWTWASDVFRRVQRLHSGGGTRQTDRQHRRTVKGKDRRRGSTNGLRHRQLHRRQGRYVDRHTNAFDDAAAVSTLCLKKTSHLYNLL